MVNRRMFRPSFADAKESSSLRPQHNGPLPSKKPAPPGAYARRELLLGKANAKPHTHGRSS